MAEPNNSIKVDQIADIILRRRWYIIIPFCAALVMGAYLAVTLPKIYSAGTLILVQPQKVPTDYVRSVVSSDIDSRLNSISQQIMSRTNLEKIIDTYNLFSGPEHEKMFMEEKIAALRKNISVNVTRTSRRSGADSFSISFKGRDPEKVMRIANTLATFVIDENLKVREAQAVGTSNFLAEELDSIRAELVAKEKILKEYREKYMGGLPEQLDSNLRILERLQGQLDSYNISLRDVKNRLAVLQESRPENPGLPTAGTLGSGTLSQMEQQLADLKTRYTANHPDVIRLEKKIADIKSEETDDNRSKKTGAAAEGRSMNHAYLAQINDFKLEQADLEANIKKILDQIHIYQKRVEDAPKREQELLSLKRDYENIKETYNSVLGRKLEAEISVNMEKKQKGEQFRIIDPARLPQKPISPDMQKIFLFTIAAGLGFGAGIVFLLEFFNKSFKSIDDVESGLGFPVLAAIPTVYKKKDILLKRAHNIVSVFFLLITFALLAGFALLTFKGVDQTVEIVKKII